jgi:hypothetical protein
MTLSQVLAAIREIRVSVSLPESFESLGHVTPEEDRLVLATLVQAIRPAMIVEVGSFVGSSTLAMCAAAPRCRIFCVDHFRGNADDRLGSRDPEEVFATFCQNMSYRLFNTVFPCVGTSAFYASVWPREAQLVFLDAGHSYEDVKQDIALWGPHVARGGILCGHDYTDDFPGVRRAVDEVGKDGHNSRIWWKVVE